MILMNMLLSVNDLLCVMKVPRSILNHLIQVHRYKLKGDKPLSFHLGYNFGCDPNGTHYYQLKKYISKMLSTSEPMFPGESFMKQSSPILEGDHPKLGDSEFVPEEEKTKYMSMMGTVQWLITLGRFDIAIAMSTLSSCRVAPHKGHLEQMK